MLCYFSSCHILRWRPRRSRQCGRSNGRSRRPGGPSWTRRSRWNGQGCRLTQRFDCRTKEVGRWRLAEERFQSICQWHDQRSPDTTRPSGRQVSVVVLLNISCSETWGWYYTLFMVALLLLRFWWSSSQFNVSSQLPCRSWLTVKLESLYKGKVDVIYTDKQKSF